MRPRVAVSGRVINRLVGGNTRYARAIHRVPSEHYESAVLTPLGKRDNAQLSSKLMYGLNEAAWWPLRYRQFDALHFPADTGPLISGRVPIVTTVHGLGMLHLTGVRSASAERSWLMRVRRAAEVSAAVITVSEASKADIVKGLRIGEGKVHVIPHGIETKFFEQPESPPPSDLPERFVLYVGNLDPRKNVTALIKGMERVHESLGVPLVVIGGLPWGHEGALREAQRQPHVTYLGPRSDSDVIWAMRRCSLFAFPSLYEGFGLPVLEAMAAGAAVLTSDRGSLPEVTGGNAIMLEDVSSRAIATEITRLLDDSATLAALRSAGPRWAATFTWDRSRRAHAEVFRSVHR